MSLCFCIFPPSHVICSFPLPNSISAVASGIHLMKLMHYTPSPLMCSANTSDVPSQTPTEAAFSIDSIFSCDWPLKRFLIAQSRSSAWDEWLTIIWAQIPVRWVIYYNNLKKRVSTEASHYQLACSINKLPFLIIRPSRQGFVCASLFLHLFMCLV